MHWRTLDARYVTASAAHIVFDVVRANVINFLPPKECKSGLRAGWRCVCVCVWVNACDEEE